MAYLSWSFLKMGEKAERRTAFLFLLMAGVPVLIVRFLRFRSGDAQAVLYAGPVLALMLLPFYLPCALRKEKTRNACSRNILFGREPLTVSFRMIVKNWVYVIYAVFPALPFLFPRREHAPGRAGERAEPDSIFSDVDIPVLRLCGTGGLSWKGAVFEAGRGDAGCRRR